MSTSFATLADVCVVACAEAWRGDGEIMASAMGTIPAISARVALASFEPELLISDGEALFICNPGPVSAASNDVPSTQVVEGWIPYKKVFDMLWWGKRHVMMGASQIDRFGNQNISCVGPWDRPKAQLLGVRGAPGNTVNHTTSYWIPSQTQRSFVDKVDMVSGVGYDRAAQAGPAASKFHEIRMVVTDKAVLDFATPDHSMRLRSVHPGYSIEDVVGATGFALIVSDDIGMTRIPTPEELDLIERIDPGGARFGEVPSREPVAL
ncbi:MAG TPA: CoA-transferase [Acidimicrobiales bacterium]|nr:CoA-transferase [Acidimicrobiales bacterium]